MPHLIDTNVLLRWADSRHASHRAVVSAIERLKEQGEAVYLTAQNLIEFWNVWTRPADRNGFGHSHAEAESAVQNLRRYFRYLPDTSDIFLTWLRLVIDGNVSGVQVHDARLAAVMAVNGLTHIVTFNYVDFVRYPGVTPVSPNDIAL